jgi:hypothetical protein
MLVMKRFQRFSDTKLKSSENICSPRSRSVAIEVLAEAMPPTDKGAKKIDMKPQLPQHFGSKMASDIRHE